MSLIPPSSKVNAQQNQTALYLSDVMTGIFSALAIRKVEVLDKQNNRLDLAFEKLFKDIESESASHKLSLRFIIRTHPLHGDSGDVQEEIVKATKRSLISFDGPEYQVVRLRIPPDEALACLKNLPGTPEMYQRLAEKFLAYLASIS